MFAPLEQEKIGTYFIPEIGPAPKWCAFLENLTEELEESNATTLYDDFKFVTQADLEKLGAADLIGTPVLRAYMHGFLMELKGYNKLVAVKDPFAYEKFRQEQIQKRLDRQRERIQVKKSQNSERVKVNQQFVDELLTKNKNITGLINDDRFKQMFEDKDFQRDVNSAEYKAVKPVSRCLSLMLDLGCCET